jgi:hypothetical protein
MRNLYKTLEHIELSAGRSLDKPQRSAATAVPKGNQKSSLRVWHAPPTDASYPSEQSSKPNNKLDARPKDTPMTTLTIRALKVTAVLDAAMVATLPTPDGQSRAQLTISCDGTNYTADVATKSLRKVKTTIATNGPQNVAVILQGRLKGDEIAECGITAQVKAAKPTEQEAGAKS